MPLEAVHIQTQHGQAQAAGAQLLRAFTDGSNWVVVCTEIDYTALEGHGNAISARPLALKSETWGMLGLVPPASSLG